MVTKNTTVRIADIPSATTIDDQIPSTPKKTGSNKTELIWKKRVLIKDIVAELIPSFNAVKNEEPKIAMPENKNENEKM